jgi:cytochrome c-type biogenesis protein CcmE
MTRKQRRGVLIGTGVAILSVAAVLMLFAIRDNIVFFYAPNEVVEKNLQPGQRFRLGGLVAEGSVQRGEGQHISFAVTDTLKTIPVEYDGILPDLFREMQGIVAEGHMDESGTFKADTVLAKHDENYMPAEVAKSLKEQGVELGKSASP